MKPRIETSQFMSRRKLSENIIILLMFLYGSQGLKIYTVMYATPDTTSEDQNDMSSSTIFLKQWVEMKLQL